MSAQIDQFVQMQLPPKELLPQYLALPEDFHAWKTLNVVQTLFMRVEERGFMDRAFLRSPHHSLTYRQAHDQVQRLSSHLLHDLKLVAGNRVLLRGANSISMALSWLAVVNAGLVAVCTMPLLRSKELKEIILKSKPALLLCQHELSEELDAARAELNSSIPQIAFDMDHTSGELFARTQGVKFQDSHCDTVPSDIALLAFTSGTTGEPKAAIHTHADILSACFAWPKHVLMANENDVVMGSPPLAFTFGLGGLLVFPMYSASAVYYHDGPYRPQSMVEIMNQVGCTICYTAPTFYRQMATIIKDHPVSTLRISVSAGEALPDSSRTLWRQASGLEMVDGIGSTEMFHIFISSGPGVQKPGAVGKVVPGYQACVLDEDGHELPRNTMGRLAVKGPTGCKYLNDQRQAKYVQHGWNITGDLFTQDEDGYFFYQARDDDMIITAGYNVSAPEVEDSLLSHPLVLECAVVGQKDDERGMVVKAFCVLKEGCIQSEELIRELQDHVKNHLAPYKYPRIIECVEQLPRTQTGKLQRFKLKQTH
jgi:2-aminobenzoate-CoA ligase